MTTPKTPTATAATLTVTMRLRVFEHVSRATAREKERERVQRFVSLPFFIRSFMHQFTQAFNIDTHSIMLQLLLFVFAAFVVFTNRRKGYVDK